MRTQTHEHERTHALGVLMFAGAIIWVRECVCVPNGMMMMRLLAAHLQL